MNEYLNLIGNGYGHKQIHNQAYPVTFAKVNRLLGDIVNEKSLAEINCHYIMA